MYTRQSPNQMTDPVGW